MEQKRKYLRKGQKNKKSERLEKILAVVWGVCMVGLIIIGRIVLFGTNENVKQKDEEIEVFTINLEGKNPEDFTWEDYQKLTTEEQMMFPDYFESMDVYNVWYESVKPNETEIEVFTINLKGKKPEDFTWEDYQKLTTEEQMVFPDYFESMDVHNAWYESVKPKETEIEVFTINLEGKTPEDFTWEDYQKLTTAEQMVFPDYFDSFDVYQRWYERVCPEN